MLKIFSNQSDIIGDRKIILTLIVRHSPIFLYAYKLNLMMGKLHELKSLEKINKINLPSDHCD